MNNHDKLVNTLQQTRRAKYDLTVFYYGKYYKKKFRVRDGFTNLLLDLKKGETKAIIETTDVINDFLPEGAIVAVVPASQRDKNNHVLDALENLKNDKDITLVPIIRTKEIGKKSINEGALI